MGRRIWKNYSSNFQLRNRFRNNMQHIICYIWYVTNDTHHWLLLRIVWYLTKKKWITKSLRQKIRSNYLSYIYRLIHWGVPKVQTHSYNLTIRGLIGSSRRWSSSFVCLERECNKYSRHMINNSHLWSYHDRITIYWSTANWLHGFSIRIIASRFWFWHPLIQSSVDFDILLDSRPYSNLHATLLK